MTRAVTFVHVADVHLDAPFGGVSAADERVRRSLVASTYEAFDRVIDVCLERDVDFLVIAGDAYNAADKNLRAQLRFQAAVGRLAEAGIRVFLARGNHDPASGWSAGLTMPDNLHEFASDRVERIEFQAEGAPPCALYGRSYATAAVTANLAQEFRREPADELAIAVLHANVGGQSDYEPYAPCSLADLRSAGMDYWALGHIHKPMLLQTDPHTRYAGSPQGLNPKEDGPHGCWVVTIEPGHIAEEFVPTASVSWARVDLDVAGTETIEQLRTAVREACEREREAAAGTPLVMRLDIAGRCAVHTRLARAGAWSELVGELRDEQLAGSPWLYLDRVRDLTRSPLDLDALRDAEDFTGDLVRIADHIRKDGSAFVDEVLSGLDGSVGRHDRDADELIGRAIDLCLDRLIGDDDR